MSTTRIGIDVDTRSVNYLLRRLNKLKAVESAEDGGMYHQDKSYSQIHLVTSMTQEQVDDWLHTCKMGDHDYTGTFPMEPETSS